MKEQIEEEAAVQDILTNAREVSRTGGLCRWASGKPQCGTTKMNKAHLDHLNEQGIRLKDQVQEALDFDSV